MKSVSRKLAALAVVALGAAACGDDVTTAPPTTTSTAQVHSVTVTPSSATVAQGSSFTFGASVDADAGLARTVTWSAAGGTGITVDAAGVASASATATGVASICATSTVDSGVKGCASLTVAGAAAAATIQIDAITVGCHPLNAALPGAAGCGLLVPVQTNNVGGQIDVAVIVNRPPNSGVTGVALDVLGTAPGGVAFATVEATYTQTLSGDFIATTDGLAAQATTQTNRIVFSVQTAAYVLTGNVAKVTHVNGQKKLRARLVGGAQTGQAETQLSFRNANGWHVFAAASNPGNTNVSLATGTNANTTCGTTGAVACNIRTNSTTTGLNWNGGTGLSVTASAINFTNFPVFAQAGVGTGIAFGSACDLSGLGLRSSSTANTTLASNTSPLAAGTGPVITGTLPYTNGAAAAAGTLNAYAIAPAPGVCGAAGEIPFAVAVDQAGNNFINFFLGGAFAGNVYNNLITPLDPTVALAVAIRMDNAGPAPIAGYATGRNQVGLDRCYGLFLNTAQLDGNSAGCPANVAANTVGGLGAISINSSTAAAFVGGRTARLNGWINDAVNFGALSSTGATNAPFAGVALTTVGDPNGAIAPSVTASGLPADVGIGNAITFTARIGACTTIAGCAALASRTSTTGITQETNSSNPTAGVANPGYGAIIQTVDVFGNVTNPPAIGANFLLVSNPLDPANPYVVAGVLYLGLDRTLPTVSVLGAAGTTATASTIQILSAANFTYTADDPVPTGNFASSGVLTAAPGGDLYVSMGRRDGATLQYFCATAVNYQPASNACGGVTGWATGVTAQTAVATAATATVYNRAAGVVLSDPGASVVRAYYAITAFSRDQAGNQTSAANQLAGSRDFIFDNTPPSSFGATFSPGVFPANAAVVFTGNATEDLDVGRGAFSIRFPVLNFVSNAIGGDFIRLPWANKNVTGQLANPIGYLAPGPSSLALSLSSTWTSSMRSIEVVDAGGAAAFVAANAAWTGAATAGAIFAPGTITAMNGGAGYVQDGNLANGAGPTQFNFFSQSVSRVGLLATGLAPAQVPLFGGTALTYGQTGMSTGTMPCSAAVPNAAGLAAYWTATQAITAVCALTGTNNPFFNMGWAIQNTTATLDLDGLGGGGTVSTRNYTAIALGQNAVMPAPFVTVKFYAVDIRQPLNVDASGGIAAAPAPAALLAVNGAGIALVELCTVTGTGSSTPGAPGIFNDQVTNTWQYTCAVNTSTGGTASILQTHDFYGYNFANTTSQHRAGIPTAAANGFWGVGMVAGVGFNQGWQGGAPAAYAAAAGMPVIAIGCNQNGNCLSTRVNALAFVAP